MDTLYFICMGTTQSKSNQSWFLITTQYINRSEDYINKENENEYNLTNMMLENMIFANGTKVNMIQTQSIYKNRIPKFPQTV